MNDKDRIKLAEAIGLVTTIGEVTEVHEFKQLPRNWDPFTDANDDYAVLEWMRKPDNWLRFAFKLASDNVGSNYKIGDYARAALKVLDNNHPGEGQ